MKVKITCPKCRSTNINITSDASDLENKMPMYKCNSCGYKHNLFPKLWGEENKKQEPEEDLD